MVFRYEYGIAIVLVSLFLICLNINLCIFLGKKIRKHHSLTLKDTAIYPVIIAISIMCLLTGKFAFYAEKPSVLDGIGSSLKESISIVAMSLNTDFIEKMLVCSDISSKFVMATYVSVYIVSGLALLSISISLVFVSGANLFRRFQYRIIGKTIDEVDYIFGFNDDCKEYIKNYYEDYLKPNSNPKKLIKAKNKWCKASIKNLINYEYEINQINVINEKIKEIKEETSKYINDQTKLINDLKNVKNEIVLQKQIIQELKDKISSKQKEFDSFLFNNKLDKRILKIKQKQYRINKDLKILELENDVQDKIKNYTDSIKILKITLNQETSKLVKLKNDKKFKRTTRRKVYNVIDNSVLSKHENEKFYLNKYKCLFVERSYGNDIEMYRTFCKVLSKNKNKKIKIIGFFDDDKPNFNFVSSALKYLEEQKKNGTTISNEYMDLTERVEFIVVCNIEQEKFLNNMINKSKDDRIGEAYNDNTKGVIDVSDGKIRIVNKYDLISLEFVKNHNFAKYLTNDALEGRGFKFDDIFNDDLTIKENVDINLYILGLGKVNQAVLRDVLICNQFVQKVKVGNKYKLVPKRMNVEIYDSKKKIECFDLNNGIFKYNKLDYSNKNKYLDVPDDYISHRHLYQNKSIYEDKFINKLFNEINDRSQGKEIIDNRVIYNNDKKKLQINYFVISLDTDFQNSDIALKLRNNIDHIDNTYNVYFIRVKNSDYDVKYKINGFGSNRDILKYDNVVADHINQIAKKYAFEYEMSFVPIEERAKGIEYIINEQWKKKTPIERLSNLYAAYGLYFKMSLLLLKKDKNETLKDFFDKNYRRDNREYYKDNNIDGFYKSLYEVGDSVQLTDFLAFLEHERWNAYELSQSALPMSKDYCRRYADEICQRIINNSYGQVYGKQICEQKGENKYKIKFTKTYDELYHLAIASSEGLKEFYGFLLKLNQSIKEKYNFVNTYAADVVYYDYQNMDIIYDDLIYNWNKFKDIYDDVIKFNNNKN